ncbi:MAG: M81 family metallopeptidase [Candidatus Latescibacterota bacterium]|nr:M81 family metallopeptidase [Candidatus Latescibacterota bacterium]
MRVAIAGFSHESNTFSSQPTGVNDFDLSEGQDLICHYRDTFHELSGYIAGAEKYGYEIFPIIAAGATPAAHVTTEAYEKNVDLILAGLKNGPSVDGVLLALHGAMVAEGFPHADAETVKRVREQIGSDVPMVVTHDYHSNIPPELVEMADALVVYKTNPHIDQRERGLQAASILVDTIHGKVKPVMALAKPELVYNIYFHNTSTAPMQPLMEMAKDLEQKPGILACSIAAGYQYADVPHMGPSIVVVTDGDIDLAELHAQSISKRMWDLRDELIPQVPNPAQAVELAKNSNKFPVCLLDFGDNIGGGSTGDSTFILHELLVQSVEGWVCTLWDPEGAEKCFKAGINERVDFLAGGHTDKMHGEPCQISGRVRTLHDGIYEEMERRHGGGRRFDQGRTAVIDVDGKGLLVLNSIRSSPNSIHQITSVGIQPLQHRILVAKGAVAPRAAYEPFCTKLIEVASGGATDILRNKDQYEFARSNLYEWQN